MDFDNKMAEAVGADNVLRGESMADHTTFRIGGKADYFITVTDENMLRDGIRVCREEDVSFYVTGKGSNLLVGDGGFRGVIFNIFGKMDRTDFTEEDGQLAVVCEAGELLSHLARSVCEKGYTGMEYAVGIPGTVGGGAAMNAGAYGGQISDNICWADVMDSQGNVLHLTADELELGYRRSIILQNNYIVLRAGFRFQPGDPEKISARVQEISASRREKQPLEYPSAGSTFKRPDGYYSGKLIQDCGLKGYRIGGAEVSTKHSGFVINVDHATADDVVQLIAHIRSEVMRRFNVNIEPEVRFIGEFTGKVDI